MKHVCTCFRIVAPSLVIVTLLFASLIILSIPLGPNDVRMASAKALAARMLDLRISVKRQNICSMESGVMNSFCQFYDPIQPVMRSRISWKFLNII